MYSTKRGHFNSKYVFSQVHTLALVRSLQVDAAMVRLHGMMEGPARWRPVQSPVNISRTAAEQPFKCAFAILRSLHPLQTRVNTMVDWDDPALLLKDYGCVPIVSLSANTERRSLSRSRPHQVEPCYCWSLHVSPSSGAGNHPLISTCTKS